MTDATGTTEMTDALLDLRDRLALIASMPPGENRDREVRDGHQDAEALRALAARQHEEAPRRLAKLERRAPQ